MKIWTCKIGEIDFDQHGADAPMRRAVREAYIKVTGEDPAFIFSGWGGELTDAERADVDGREPTPSPAPSEGLFTAEEVHAICAIVWPMSSADHSRHLTEKFNRLAASKLADREKRVEVLKVWYSIFVAIMDTPRDPEQDLALLVKLRERLKRESPELEAEFARREAERSKGGEAK